MAEFTRNRNFDYNAHMQCNAGDGWLPRAVDQIGSWLREKNLDVDLGESDDCELPGASMSVRRLADSTSADFKLNLVENNPTGQWATEVHVHDEPNGADWITLSVHSGHGGFVKVPRLARYLMQVLPLSDASIEFSDGPQTFHDNDMDRLMSLLADGSRHGLVFVAGTNDTSVIPVPAFANKVGDWAKEVYGLAQVIVLDPAATKEFESQVGARFSAPPWTIRTYQPGVQFDDPVDARRHRILGTERLGSQSDAAIRRLLGDIARQQAASRPEDPAVLRARRRLERFENRRLLEVLKASTAAAPALDLTEPVLAPVAAQETTLETAHEELALVRRVLGVEQVNEASLADFIERTRQLATSREALQALQRRVEELQGRSEQLEDANVQLREAIEDSQMEAEIASLDVDNRDARIRWLTERLKAHDDFEASYADTPSEFLASRPENFSDLLTRLEDIDGVEFTGDVSEVERLNQIDTNDAALRTAWEAVTALRDYVRARADGVCTQGLDHYIRHTPSGYQTIPHGKFAETETGTTMNAYGRERIFPIPAEVSPEGKATMKAHFKLARIGMVSPRMHIFDGNPGVNKVYIGYIGAHLTNTQTN